MTVWELRFTDGRGASFFTKTDPTADLGNSGVVRTFVVAADVSRDNALADAIECLREGITVEMVANMAAVAYAVRRNV
jgi:hypothetical protein